VESRRKVETAGIEPAQRSHRHGGQRWQAHHDSGGGLRAIDQKVARVERALVGRVTAVRTIVPGDAVLRVEGVEPVLPDEASEPGPPSSSESPPSRRRLQSSRFALWVKFVALTTFAASRLEGLLGVVSAQARAGRAEGAVWRTRMPALAPASGWTR
jgi:hypothetical protein